MGGSVLLICRSAPYGGESARDALDLAMAFGAFEREVALLLLGDGVLLLSGSQDSSALGMRNLGRLCGALADYGVGPIHVDALALAERGLDAAELVVPVHLLEAQEIAQLIAAHDVVLGV